jgi:hypothetical protein
MAVPCWVSPTRDKSSGLEQAKMKLIDKSKMKRKLEEENGIF